MVQRQLFHNAIGDLHSAPVRLVGSQVQWLALHSWRRAANVEPIAVADIGRVVFARIDSQLACVTPRQIVQASALGNALHQARPGWHGRPQRRSSLMKSHKTEARKKSSAGAQTIIATGDKKVQVPPVGSCGPTGKNLPVVDPAPEEILELDQRCQPLSLDFGGGQLDGGLLTILRHSRSFGVHLKRQLRRTPGQHESLGFSLLAARKEVICGELTVPRG